MKLLTAHKIMIATAIAFSAGFAVREAVLFARSGDALPLVLAIGSAAAAIALAAYIRWLLRAKRDALAPAAKRRR